MEMEFSRDSSLFVEGIFAQGVARNVEKVSSFENSKHCVYPFDSSRFSK